jgi:hypothetical protein
MPMSVLFVLDCQIVQSMILVESMILYALDNFLRVYMVVFVNYLNNIILNH